MSDSAHPCAYHYRVTPPDYWCEVCQAFRKPMNESATPQPSPASLLAAVLRVVAPDHHWIPYEWYLQLDNKRGNVWALDHRYFPDSKGDLARVVAMLDGAQTARFDLWMEQKADAVTLKSGQPYCGMMPSDTLKATPAQILAALVAATGARV